MRITLSNVKISKSLSEETLAYTANVLINKKKVATATNRGEGGMTMIHLIPNGDRDLLKQAEEWASTQTAEFPEEWGGGSYTLGLDGVVDQLAADHELMQDVKRMIRGKLAFLRPEDRGTGAFSFYTLPKSDYRYAPKLEQLRRLHPDWILADDDLGAFVSAMKDPQTNA